MILSHMKGLNGVQIVFQQHYGGLKMKIIEQSHEILHIDGLERIEIAGRTCYKSEDKITQDSADRFVKMLIKRGHEAMIEHGSATVKFITDRGVTHELVRHRTGIAFGQESTRYVNYGGDDIQFIHPVWCSTQLLNSVCIDMAEMRWHQTMHESEEAYKSLLRHGWQPEHARSVLPNSLKTEIVVTANFREWRHIFKLRAVGTTGKPHPQMQALMIPVLKEFASIHPALFGDLLEKL